ncbi:hypothetical protein ACXEJ6_003871 [Klebsiella pneumoniae]|uniref:hypothetical protein n=1 Tax=Klebsiella pneumoniae TaxID=573 RepID=UPI002A965375|nr:hypothetical protein [Klebsiella pneumoniae]
MIILHFFHIFNKNYDSESGHHYLKNPPKKAGFCFSASGLFIELRSIIRRTAAHPFGASAASALFNACGVSPSPGTTI